MQQQQEGWGGVGCGRKKTGAGGVGRAQHSHVCLNLQELAETVLLRRRRRPLLPQNTVLSGTESESRRLIRKNTTGLNGAKLQTTSCLRVGILNTCAPVNSPKSKGPRSRASHERGNTDNFLGQGTNAFKFLSWERSLIKTVGCVVTALETQGESDNKFSQAHLLSFIRTSC